jgi:hypothetical protein
MPWWEAHFYVVTVVMLVILKWLVEIKASTACDEVNWPRGEREKKRWGLTWHYRDDARFFVLPKKGVDVEAEI